MREKLYLELVPVVNSWICKLVFSDFIDFIDAKGIAHHFNSLLSN